MVWCPNFHSRDALGSWCPHQNRVTVGILTTSAPRFMYVFYIPIQLVQYTYIHTYIHACMHACMHASMHTCIHAYMHTCVYIIFVAFFIWKDRSWGVLYTYIYIHTCIPNILMSTSTSTILRECHLAPPRKLLSQVALDLVCTKWRPPGWGRMTGFHPFPQHGDLLIDAGFLNIICWCFWEDFSADFDADVF